MGVSHGSFSPQAELPLAQGESGSGHEGFQLMGPVPPRAQGNLPDRESPH